MSISALSQLDPSARYAPRRAAVVEAIPPEWVPKLRARRALHQIDDFIPIVPARRVLVEEPAVVAQPVFVAPVAAPVAAPPVVVAAPPQAPALPRPVIEAPTRPVPRRPRSGRGPAGPSHPGRTRRSLAALSVFALGVLGLGGAGLVMDSPTSQATPGTPGVPQPPISIANENFQSVATTPVSIVNYPRPAGVTYTVDGSISSTAMLPSANKCNGWVLNSTSPALSSDTGCVPSSTNSTWAQMQMLARVLGQAQGMNDADAAANNVLAEGTLVTGSNQLVKVTTSVPPVAGHLYYASYDLAMTGCADAPSTLSTNVMLTQTNGGTSLATGSVNPCTSSSARTYLSSYQTASGSESANVTTLHVLIGPISVSSLADKGPVFTVVGSNGAGMVWAVDNIQFQDVTPQLDWAFSPTTVPAGATSTLTFTVTNTSELLGKSGPDVTFTLPDGLTAVPGTNTKTCSASANKMTLSNGNQTIDMTNNIPANTALCQQSVKVTSNIPAGQTANFTLQPSAITTLTSLQAPNAAGLTVDGTPPDAPVITAPEDGSFTNQASPPITGTAEPGSSVVATIDGDPACTATADSDGDWSCDGTATLTDGEHTLAVTAADAVGNTSEVATSTFTVDLDAPDAPVITSLADDAVLNHDVSSISGTGEANATVHVTDNDAAFCQATVAADGTWSCTGDPALTDGDHVIRATQTDAAGSESAPDRIEITIDTVAPSPPQITYPSTGSLLNANDPQEVDGTGEAGAHVDVTEATPSGTQTVCSTDVGEDGTWTCTSDTAWTQGAHTFSVTQTDAAGNRSDAATVSFEVDTQAPAAPVVSAPSGLVNTTLPTISGTGVVGAAITVTDANNVPVCHATVAADGTWSCVPTSALPQGQQTLAVSQADAAGNASLSQNVTFGVDSIAPDVPIVTTPAQNALLNSAKPIFSGTGEAGAQIAVASASPTLSRSQLPLCTATVTDTGAWTCASVDDIPQGANTVSVTQTDAAGNQSDAQSVTFSVDSIAPAAPSITAPSPGAVLDEGRPVIQGTGEAGAHVKVLLDDQTVCEADVAGTTWACAPDVALSNGPVTLSVRQTDAAGNRSDAATVAFTVDTVKPATPSVTSPAPGALLATSTPAFSGTGGEANAAVTVSEGDLDLCTAPVQADGSWTCTPAEHLTQGAHTVTVTQTDLAGNPSDPASVSFSIDSQRPAAPVVLGPANGLVTSQKYPAISGSGEPGATVVVTEGTDTVCTAIVGGDASWSCTPTIALAVGDHTLTVVQHDPAGNESAETTVSFRVVSDTLAAPAITAPTSGAVTNAATQVISGTGQSGSQVSVLDGGETTACTATVQASGTWTCTASLSDGVHTLTATQSAAGQMSPASAPVALRVDTSAPLAPVVTSPADNAVINDPTPSITGTGEAGAQVSVTEGSTVLCAQVAVSAAGTWSCVPGIVLDEGAHTLSVRQTDAAGNDSPVRSASFTIDTTPPQVTVNPTDGLSVSGTAEPGAVVDVYDAAGNVVPGCQHLIADAQGQFGCMPATPLEPGEQVQVSVTDAAGNVTRQGGVAAQMRSLALNPVGNVGAGAKPVFSGTGQPGYQVRVTSGSDTLCTATVAASGTWSCTSDLPLTDGSHTLSAVQTDGAGHSSAPTIAALSVPVTGVTLNPVATVASGGKPALSGTGQPGYQVRVSSGDTALCSATVADDGTWACTSAVPLDSGDYTLTVMQADATGNTSAPAQQQLSIAPAGVDIGTIVNPGGDSPLMHGTGEPGAHIAVTDADGNIMCTATVAADGTWSCQVDGPIAQGATVTATQTAASGQTVTSATVGANGFADNVPAGGTNVPAAPWGALGGLGLMAALGLAVMGFHRRYLAIEVATSADTERKER